MATNEVAVICSSRVHGMAIL